MYFRTRGFVALAAVAMLAACSDTTMPEVDLREEQGNSRPDTTAGDTTTIDTLAPRSPLPVEPPTLQALSRTPQAIPQVDAAFAGRYHGVVDVITDKAGNIHAALVDRGNGGGVLTRIVYASYNGTAWDAGTVVSGVIRADKPRVAVDGNGGVHMFWLENKRGTSSGMTDVMYSKLDDGVWSQARNLYHETGRSGNISVDVIDAGTDAFGNVFVVHFGEGPGPGARGLITHVQSGNDFIEVRDMNQGAYDLRVAENGGQTMQVLVSNAELIEEDYVEGEPYLFPKALVLRTIDRTGATEKSMIFYSDKDIAASAFEIDARGVRHVLWAEMSGAHPTEGATFKLRYSHSADGRTWSAPIDVGSATGYSDDVIQMTVDASGRVHAVLYSVDNSLVHMTLDNGVWSAPRTITTSTHAQFQLASAGGRPVVIWRSGSGYKFVGLE